MTSSSLSHFLNGGQRIQFSLCKSDPIFCVFRAVLPTKIDLSVSVFLPICRLHLLPNCGRIPVNMFQNLPLEWCVRVQLNLNIESSVTQPMLFHFVWFAKRWQNRIKATRSLDFEYEMGTDYMYFQVACLEVFRGVSLETYLPKSSLPKIKTWKITKFSSWKIHENCRDFKLRVAKKWKSAL